MKSQFLAAVAAGALAFGMSSYSLAQDKEQAKPGAEHMEKAAPGAQHEMNKPDQKAETPERREAPKTGQAEPRKEMAPKAAETERKEAPKRAETERKDAPKAAETDRREAPKGAAMERKDSPKAAETDRKSERKPDQAEATPKSEMRTGDAKGHDDAKGRDVRVNGRITVTQEKATRVSETLRERGKSENLDIRVNVGERLPERIVLYPVPEDIVEMAPEYRGYDYVIDNDEIVFVQPDTHEIVGTIEYESRAAADDSTVSLRRAKPCPTED